MEEYLTIQNQHKKVTLQTDFPVPTEYFQYFYKPSLMERKKIPLGFVFNDTRKVKLTRSCPFGNGPAKWTSPRSEPLPVRAARGPSSTTTSST